MKLENTKNASRIIVSGMTANVVNMFLQFIFRTVFIHRLGVEYLGLNSLYSSILNVLNVAELGLCSAIIFCMYKAIANDDTETIGALMLFFKRCYQIIGLVVALVGIALIPFLKIIINKDIPSDVNIYILYLLALASPVASYYMYSYKICLLSAYQRVDIKNSLAIKMGIIQYTTQIILLFIINNYYLYLITNIVFKLLGNFVTGRAVDKYFPNIKAKGKLDKSIKKEIFSKVKGMLIYKISGILSSSFDSFVISSFLGLVVLGKLNNYTFISSSVASILAIFTSSIVAGIGNTLALKSKNECYSEFESISFLYNWVFGWCSICILCLAQPFIKIWAGNNFILPTEIVLELALLFYITQSTSIPNVFREASGIWDKDKLRPLIAAIANLICNIILVEKLGILGVLLSSIVINLVFNYGWSTKVLFREIFQLSGTKYHIQSIQFFIITALGALVTFNLTNLIVAESVMGLILRGVVCIIVPNVIYIVFMRKLSGYADARKFFERIVKNLINPLKARVGIK